MGAFLHGAQGKLKIEIELTNVFIFEKGLYRIIWQVVSLTH